jgi:hypothetical protein
LAAPNRTRKRAAQEQLSSPRAETQERQLLVVLGGAAETILAQPLEYQ